MYTYMLSRFARSVFVFCAGMKLGFTFKEGFVIDVVVVVDSSWVGLRCMRRSKGCKSGMHTMEVLDYIDCTSEI